jgi:hypothetical protein
MKTYETVIGTKRLNEYIQHGWTKDHTFTKPTEFSDDGNTVVDVKPAFVIVWDQESEPWRPKEQSRMEGQPLVLMEMLGEDGGQSS